MVDVRVPGGWRERNARIEDSYILAVNDNEVEVGYNHLAPDAFSVWAGEGWYDNKTLTTIDDEDEAIILALEFMRKYPEAVYRDGRLVAGDGSRISRITR